jgi:Uma2 family endonuclease
MVARPNVKFLANDIWEMPDDGNWYEVVDGELVVTPAPGWQHQRALRELVLLLGNHVHDQHLGEIMFAPIGVVLDEYTAVEPDLVFISRDRMALISERGIEGAPDLVVEILSPRTETRDRTVKMRRYARAGVPHYWIVAPATRSLEAYRLGADGYEPIGAFGPGSIFEPELLPGLVIPIDRLWD